MIPPPLSHAELVRILGAYDAGSLLEAERVWWAPENAVYLVTTTREKLVLKAHDDKLRKLPFVIRVMQHLERSGIPVPELKKTTEGRSVYALGSRRITAQKLIAGKGCDRVSLGVVRDAGRVIGRLDACLLALPLRGRYVSHPFFNWPMTNPKTVRGFRGADAARTLNDELRNIDLRKARRSVVHGDAGGSNILQRNGKITGIIDWDEVQEGYVVQDAAAFIAHALVHRGRIDRSGLSAFMSGYQRSVRLSLEELKLLRHFVLRRYLAVIPWLARHADKDRVDALIDDHAGRYRRFRSLPMRDFLSLVG